MQGRVLPAQLNHARDSGTGAAQDMGGTMTNAISAYALSAAVLTSTLTPAIAAESAIDSGTVRAWALGESQPATSESTRVPDARCHPRGPTSCSCCSTTRPSQTSRRCRNVRRLLTQAGTTFTRAYSPPALCCPARATILTGRYPHNTRVVGNAPPFGGYQQFRDGSNDSRRTSPTTTGPVCSANISTAAPRSVVDVPPGWDVFKMVRAKSELSFLSPTMSINGRTQNFPGP